MKLIRFVTSLARTHSAKLCLAACAGLPGLPAPALAADPVFPTRPVTLIVAQPPGASHDLTGREIARGLQQIWGQTVIVENKAGASGMIGAEAAVRAVPDGHTLFFASDSTTVVLPFLTPKMTYNPVTDLKPIGLVSTVSLILVANPSLKVNTLKEFIALAKERPGLNYASGGVGAAHHMSMELLQKATGIKLTQVPYKGGAPALQDVIAGHVPVTWAGLGNALPHVKSGKLVALAVGGQERSLIFPNVPTVAELGYPDFNSDVWFGIMAPAGIPPALAKKIETDLQTVVRSPQFRERAVGMGNRVITSTSEEFAKRIQTEYARNKAILSTAGLSN
jgi:tripartite-type tricarboxylate transporter receptor subunit TctC